MLTSSLILAEWIKITEDNWLCSHSLFYCCRSIICNSWIASSTFLYSKWHTVSTTILDADCVRLILLWNMQLASQGTNWPSSPKWLVQKSITLKDGPLVIRNWDFVLLTLCWRWKVVPERVRNGGYFCQRIKALHQCDAKTLLKAQPWGVIETIILSQKPSGRVCVTIF